jgi:hypothetical protein
MPYHVVVFSRRQVADGALRFQDTLADAMMRQMVEMTQQIAAVRAAGNNIRRDQVEILALDPLHEAFDQSRQPYGPDSFIVLFLNDAARVACEMYDVAPNYVAQIEDRTLPANLGVSLRMDHYYVG